MVKNTFLCVLSAVLLSAPYLSPMLFPTAWIAFVPLLWVVGGEKNISRVIFFGWLTGFLSHISGFHWLVYTIRVFGGFPYLISAAIFLLYAALQGIQFAIFAWIIKLAGLGPLAIIPPVIWVALEFWFPSLFPWYLANSQSSFTSFIQHADLVGPYGASFIVMAASAAVYALISSYLKNQRLRWQPAALVVLLVASSLLYGAWRIDGVSRQITAAQKLSVAAVQGNIDVDLKWDLKRAQENLEVHRNLTKQISGVDLVIWPETSVEQWVPERLDKLPADIMPALYPGTYFIFGARSFSGSPSGPDLKAYNTAFLTDASGRILDHYHKQMLLAFGEYIPFAKIISKLPGMPFSDGFTAGQGPRTFNLPGGQRLAPLICYEDLIPELSRQFVKQTKANVLVNLTNDSWYGRTVAPWEHARLAQWRAIETRRSLLRVTNTGVTVLVNAKGEIGEALPIFTAGVLKIMVDVLEGETLYVRFGDWFAWGATALSLWLMASLWKRRAAAARTDSVSVGS